MQGFLFFGGGPSSPIAENGSWGSWCFYLVEDLQLSMCAMWPWTWAQALGWVLHRKHEGWPGEGVGGEDGMRGCG